MKYTFETEDPHEAKKIMLAPQMFSALWAIRELMYKVDDMTPQQMVDSIQDEIKDINFD